LAVGFCWLFLDFFGFFWLFSGGLKLIPYLGI
jgi:hypothetical protein